MLPVRLEDLAPQPGRWLIHVGRAVELDPTDVLAGHPHMDVRWFEQVLPRVDDEAEPTLFGDGRHVTHLLPSTPFRTTGELYQ